MKLWASSDWHCDWDTLKEDVVEWIRRGKEGNHRLVGVGDLFNILPCGKKKWEQAKSIEELAKLLDGYPFDYVAGNHDPYRIMRKLMAPYSNIKVHKRLELDWEGRRYFFTHGHRWSIDWGWLGLRRVAPWFVETMVDIAPGLWYKFCRRVGWLASSPRPRAPAHKEKERITKLTRIIWAGAADYALKRDCCVIIGHTHTSGRREQFISREVGFQAYMADDGNLPDPGRETYVEITDDARLRFLR